MRLRLVKSEEAKQDPSFEEMAMMVMANASDQHLKWAKDLVLRAKECDVDVSLEAGILRWGGAEYPTLAILKDGMPLMYAPCNNNDFFAKTAGPDDKYTPGPKVEIVH
jgi:hypothetical protein